MKYPARLHSAASQRWTKVEAPSAQKAAEAFLERLDAAGVELGHTAYVEVKPEKGKALRFRGDFGVGWSCEVIKGWETRSFKRRGEAPL